MSRNNCDIANNNADLLNVADEIKEEESAKDIKVLNEGEEAIEELRKIYVNGDDLDESVINKIFNDLYGKPGERIKIASKIYARMETSDSLKKILNVFIAVHAPEDIKLVVNHTYTNKEGKKVTVKRMKLSNLPITTLKNIWNESLRSSRTVEGNWIRYPLNFDGIMSHVITQKQKGYKEPTGAYWIIQDAIHDYPTSVSSRIGIFTNESLDRDDKLYGMGEVYENVGALARYTKDNSLKNQARFTSFFSRWMMGYIYQNGDKGHAYNPKIKDGEWMVYGDYQAREYDKNHPDVKSGKKHVGQLMRYKTTNDVMFSFQNPLKLSKYTPPNLTKEEGVPINKDAVGAWNPFKKLSKKDYETVLKELNKEKKTARAIDDKVFEYMKKHMKESLYGNPKNKKDLGLVGELWESFKDSGLTKEEINTIFFNPNTKAAKALKGRLTAKDKKLYDTLFDTFGTMVNDEFVIANGSTILFPDNPDYRKNHWPILYNKEVYKDMVRMLVDDFNKRVGELTLTRDSGVDNKGKPLTSQAYTSIKNRINELQAKLRNMNNILNNSKGYHEDQLNGGIVIPFKADNKYFKSVSNAYDIRSARSDNAVYYDYLKHVMSSIERNILSGKLVKALRVSSQKNTEKMNKVLSAEAINLFKTTFNTPDVQGPFSRSFPNQFGSSEAINNTLNWIPGRNKTAKELHTTYQIINNWITSIYLGGAHTVTQNKMDVRRNSIHFSKKVLNRAMDSYDDPVEGPLYRKLIQLSGITEFSEFFSRSMINGILDVKLEQEVTDGLLKEMMDYHYRINKQGMKESKSDEIFRENISIYLAASNRLVSPDEVVIIENETGDYKKTKADIKKEIKELRQQRRLALSNQLVQLAITKSFVFTDAIKKVSWKDFANKPITTTGRKLVLDPAKNVARMAVEGYLSIWPKEYTMSNTERYIRSISFIIGVQRAIKNGRLDGPSIDDVLKNNDEIRQAIFDGRAHSDYINFALSTQAIGKVGQGGFGKFWNRFKTWSTQKFGLDSRLYKEAYITLKRQEKIANDTFDRKAVGKLIKALFRPSKYNRTNAPEVAALRHFLLTQGTATIMFDILTLGVIPQLSALKTVLYYGTGVRSLRGYTSDLVSFIMMVPLLLLRARLGADDDDDEDDGDAGRTFKYYLRKTHFGFGAVWTWDMIQMLLYQMGDKQESAFNTWLDWMGPFTGGSSIVGKLFKAGAKQIHERKED